MGPDRDLALARDLDVDFGLDPVLVLNPDLDLDLEVNLDSNLNFRLDPNPAFDLCLGLDLNSDPVWRRQPESGLLSVLLSFPRRWRLRPVVQEFRRPVRPGHSVHLMCGIQSEQPAIRVPSRSGSWPDRRSRLRSRPPGSAAPA